MLAAMAATAAGLAYGQTYEQLAPKPVREGPPPAATQPALREAPPTSDSTVLLPRLAGLRLIPSADRVVKSAEAARGAVVIDGLPWLDRAGVETVAGGFLSRPLTKGDLALLVQKLVVLCRATDRPVVEVYAPPQDVSNGVLQVVVLVAKLGRVGTEGNKWFPSSRLIQQVRLKPGQDITGESLLEDLNWLNQNPFRQVDLVYARGAEPGQTDVILRVADTRPERVYAGYDDTGNKSTGLGRVYAGFNLGDLCDADNEFNYQYTRSTDWNELEAHSASYTLPLPNRDTVSLIASWARADSVTQNIFDLTGINWQVGGRYTVILPAKPGFNESLVLGVDYKWSNNNLGFGGTQIFSSPASLVQGLASYTASRADAHGAFNGSLTGYLSPGGIGGQNHDHDFVVQRAGARADYGYVVASLERLQKLTRGYTLSLTGLGQWSSARLLSSEQFGLGGESSIRGYDERIVNGDDGIAAQLELRTPTQHLVPFLHDSTQELVFVDAGRDWQRDPQQGEVNSTLASAGPGLRLQLGNYGTIKADYGWQLDRLAGTRTGRVHLSAVLSF